MSDSILLKIHEELVAIRELLAKQQTAAPAKTYSGANSGGASSGPDKPIPQPGALVDDPDSVVIPWGKNSGKKLSELSERSLDWYASVKDARLDSSGKPYPPKPADVALENAARQIHHRRLGTLGGSPAQTQGQTRIERNMSPQASAEDLENVPFAARYYDHG